jgi:membrane fusion protein (multidrug efflux system)
VHTPKTVSPVLAVAAALVTLAVPACHPHHDEHAHHERHNIVVTSPQVRDVIVTQQYVGQIRSRRNIEVRPLQEGYLEAINVREGQAVKAGDLLFAVVPTLYKARLAAEQAKLQSAQLQYDNTAKLAQQNIVSPQEVALKLAELNEAKARLNQAETELAFTQVKAPFDGIIDRFQQQQGSLVKKEDVLTTLSDNAVMWVYFNVPETRYLEYMAGGRERESRQIGLVLADGSQFPHPGDVGAIEAKFNNETGNIPFRADFPNPDRLLRHGQTGNVLIHRTLKGALVIPQRATFEILDKRYVFVVGPDGVVKQREITIQQEQDDIFLVGKGLAAGERFVLEGVRQVKDGEKVEYEYCKPEEALAHQKHHAE